ncbi:Ubiquitin carboxyl-terminal hydrolase 45 [Blastocladiella emersonii ATCC 22665]|nr:Ubiquitin carboxyl-terminal hydrolase 45 [Blastocladiella emersonii ATCC 22665]
MGSNRAKAKKGQRLAEKREERKRAEDDLKQTVTAVVVAPSDASSSSVQAPDGESKDEVVSAPTTADRKVSKKKCSHFRSAIKIKKIKTAPAAAFSQAAPRCSARPCRSSTDSQPPLWMCLCCLVVQCEADHKGHEHPIHSLVPQSGVDYTTAMREGLVRVCCLTCEGDVDPTKYPLMVEALAAVRTRFEEMATASARKATGASAAAIDDGDDSALDGILDRTHAASSRPAASALGKSSSLKPAEYLALGAHGLSNLGNTCYANSLMQVLAHARHLAVPSYSECEGLDAVSAEFYLFLRDMAETSGAPTLAPGAVLTELGHRFKEFRNFRRQNDSHEMMRCLFDVMDTEHLKRERERIGEVADGDGDGEAEKPERSLVAKAFCSVLQSCIKCTRCGTLQTINEDFYDFSLVISSSLTTSLAHFFAEDRVEYSCENKECPSHAGGRASPVEPSTADDETAVAESPFNSDEQPSDSAAAEADDDEEAPVDDEGEENTSTTARPPAAAKSTSSIPPVPHTKRYRIHTLAPTLCVQLKRTPKTKKTRIDFPLHLSLREQPHPTGDANPEPAAPVRYELFGVVEHAGTMNFGHYTAYVKVHQPALASEHRGTRRAVPRGEDGEAAATWFLMNDARVTKVSEGHALHSNPYLLFYQRIE